MHDLKIMCHEVYDNVEVKYMKIVQRIGCIFYTLYFYTLIEVILLEVL